APATTTAPANVGPVAASGPTMGSTWLVRLRRVPAGSSADSVRDAVQAVLDRVEGEMSTYRADSDLSRFNQDHTGDWVAVPAEVDLAGIAKGYAAELAARRLDELGAADYLVEVGGEVRTRGVAPAGRPWRVGIETPTPGVRRVLYTVELPDLSLSTSGDYRNF